jgi:feruloyl esterase
MGVFARPSVLSVRLLLSGLGFSTLCVVSGAMAGAAEDCTKLAELVVENTTITSARLIPAGGAVNGYCEVQGRVDTEIGFEVRLPTDWNGKFYFQGIGGFAGEILAPGPALMRGYAEVTTDTGHQGQPPLPQLDATWALRNPKRQINWGHRAVHVVTVAAKEIVQAFYGRPSERSYFEGCANGGRQGLMEAQRYPADFDGIIAGAPALDWTGKMMSDNWNMQALERALIPVNKVALVAREVLAECDAEDGLADGLISDPRRCRFDPGNLQCLANDAPNCLTAEQVESVRMIYAGPVNSEGARIYPPVPQGHEDGDDGWPMWITGDGMGPPVGAVFQDQFLRFFLFGPKYDPRAFDFDTDPPLLAPTGEFIDAVDSDLSAFNAAGGKLIMWQGWADPAVPPLRTVAYYEEVVDVLGSNTNQFFRLFMAPGVHHCAGSGPGPNTFDMLTALENWVEDGTAPERIIASHQREVVDRTRPLCPYPQEARYVGKGSIDDAANFDCCSFGGIEPWCQPASR